jgi:hypothetical protein
LRLKIYNGTSGGNLHSLLTNNPVSLTNSLFTATFDTGPGVFNECPRWLRMEVRSNSTPSGWTPLAP